MAGKLKKRYFGGGVGVFRALREGVSRPLSFVLLSLFLLTHAVAVYAEVRVEHWPESSSKTAEVSFDGRCDLQAEAANWRELRSSREGAEHRLNNKLEVRTLHHEFTLDSSRDFPTLQFFSSTPLLCSSSLCEAPFSPRPPPAQSSLQG